MPKKMSSRIYFQGETEQGSTITKYNPNIVYQNGQLCTDLVTMQKELTSRFVLLKCIEQSTTGDFWNMSERTDACPDWSAKSGSNKRGGATIFVYQKSRALSIVGKTTERGILPLKVSLELQPGRYMFTGVDGSSSGGWYLDWGDNRSYSGLFDVTETTKNHLRLVIEPGCDFGNAGFRITPRLMKSTGSSWRYHWDPNAWEEVPGVAGYNSKKQYKPGNKCIHNYIYYKCTTITPKSGEPFTPVHWEEQTQKMSAWLDHVMISYNGKLHKAMYLYTNACLSYSGLKSESYRVNGLDVVVNKTDHSFKIVGTATDDTYIKVCDVTLYRTHSYYMDGCPGSDSKNKYYLRFTGSNFEYNSYDVYTLNVPKNVDYYGTYYIVIKKGTEIKEDSDPFVPELNDAACYDSNCNGLIWKRWSTGPYDLEDVEMKPVSRMYIYWNGQNYSYNYGRWYTLYEMFGWGDSYGVVASSYMSNYTSDSLPMITFSTGSHQVLLASYAIGYRGIFISQNGVDWLRVHDTQNTGSGWGGRRLANGNWWWLQAIPGPGDGFFMATYSSTSMNPGVGYKYIVTYVHLAYNSNESDFTTEVFNEILKTYSSIPTVVPGLEFIQPIGSMSSTFFFSVDRSYYSFSHVGELNDGKPVISLSQFNISAYLYRDGTMIYPEEGTFEHALWVHEYGKETHSVWDSMDYHLNIAETLCVGCFNGVLVFNIITYSQFSTVRYYHTEQGWERSERYGDSYLSHLIVKFTGNGSYTISDSTGFDFNAITEDVKTSSSVNKPILPTYYYGGKRYFIYGGCNYVNRGLEKDFKVYTTSDGEHFELLSSPGPDASWSAFKNTHDAAISSYWGFPNLSHITIKAWGEHNSTIDRDAYSANVAIFSETDDPYSYDHYTYHLGPFDYGRFIGGKSTTILAGSFYAGITIGWRETKSIEEAHYRGADVAAMIRFTGPELTTAVEFSL